MKFRLFEYGAVVQFLNWSKVFSSMVGRHRKEMREFTSLLMAIISREGELACGIYCNDTIDSFANTAARKMWIYLTFKYGF